MKISGMWYKDVLLNFSHFFILIRISSLMNKGRLMNIMNKMKKKSALFSLIYLKTEKIMLVFNLIFSFHFILLLYFYVIFPNIFI